MASIRAWAKRRLAENVDLSAIVANRIYPVRLPQRTDPTQPFLASITIKRLRVSHQEDMDGATGLAEAILEIRSWSLSLIQADELAELVIQTFENLRDTEPDTAPAGSPDADLEQAPQALTITRVHVAEEADDERLPYLADDTPIYCVVSRVAVDYRE